jgi:hypothetical protein
MTKNEPQLSDDDIEYLFRLPKPIQSEHWRRELRSRPQIRGANRSSRMDLLKLDFGYLRGSLSIFVRESLRIPEDFSVGVIYTGLDNSSCRLLRCNGPHPQIHQNSLDPGRLKFSETSHVHTATALYLHSPHHEGEHHAEPTNAFEDISGAIEHMALLMNLEPVNRLWL